MLQFSQLCHTIQCFVCTSITICVEMKRRSHNEQEESKENEPKERNWNCLICTSVELSSYGVWEILVHSSFQFPNKCQFEWHSWRSIWYLQQYCIKFTIIAGIKRNAILWSTFCIGLMNALFRSRYVKCHYNLLKTQKTTK